MAIPSPVPPVVAHTHDYEWRDRGTCNPDSSTHHLPADAWWPSGRVKPVNVTAAVECYACPVIDYCRDWVADTDPEHGVVAGEIRIMDANFVGSPAERKSFRRCIVCERTRLLKWFPTAGPRVGTCWECAVDAARGAA